jgi:hypothetical protein
VAIKNKEMSQISDSIPLMRIPNHSLHQIDGTIFEENVPILFELVEKVLDISDTSCGKSIVFGEAHILRIFHCLR